MKKFLLLLVLVFGITGVARAEFTFADASNTTITAVNTWTALTRSDTPSDIHIISCEDVTQSFTVLTKGTSLNAQALIVIAPGNPWINEQSNSALIYVKTGVTGTVMDFICKKSKSFPW